MVFPKLLCVYKNFYMSPWKCTHTHINTQRVVLYIML